MDKISLLKSTFVFSRLKIDLLEEIAKHLIEVKYNEGSKIFTQGEIAEAFFIIDSGEVTISRWVGQNDEKILSVLGPGSVFGEMAFFSDSPRTANAVTKTNCVLWKLDRNNFMNFVSEQPKAGVMILSGLLQVAMNRLDHTNRELTTIYQTGKIISSGLDLKTIIKEVLIELNLAIPQAENFAAFIYNKFNEEFDPIAAPEQAKEISLYNPIIERIKQNLTWSIFNEPFDNNFLNEFFIKNVKSILIVPLVKKQELSGFIILWNSTKTNIFKNNHCLLAYAVGCQLAEAIENLQYKQEEIDRQRLNNAKQSY